MVFRASSHGFCATSASRFRADDRVFEAMVDGWRTQMFLSGADRMLRSSGVRGSIDTSFRAPTS
jgi:hypothetical protein